MKVPEYLPTEAEEQKIVVAWLRHRQVPLFAVPNEAKRSMALAAHLRAMGLTSGAPDIVLIRKCPKDPQKSVAVEMKRRKRASVSDEQQSVHEQMRANGWIVIVAYGADDAKQQLMALGY